VVATYDLLKKPEGAGVDLVMKEKKQIIEMYETLLKDETNEDTIENYIWNIEYLESVE